MMTKVSIILPVFNAEKTIKLAIDSILTQSYQDFELLIYDDHSTDKSIKIIENYSDSRIAFFKGKQNIGSLKSRNFLFKKAKGEFFIFQDADDISNKNRIKKLLNHMQKNPYCGLCGSNVNIYDEKERFCTKTNKPLENDIISLKFKTKVPIYFPSSIVRREVYEKIGGLNEYFYDLGNYDYDWMCRISEKYECANIEEALYSVMRRNISNSTTIVNPNKIIGHKLVQFLAYQRSKSGKDSLETNINELNEYAAKMLVPYNKDKSLYTYDRIIGLMSEKLYYSSLRLSLLAVTQNPLKLRNYRTIFYIIRIWGFSILQKK